MPTRKVLVLGGTGMFGHLLYRELFAQPGLTVHATVRSLAGLEDRFFGPLRANVLLGVDADDFGTIVRAIEQTRPDTVVNCIGLIKQLPQAGDPLTAITINAQLPHRIAAACEAANARMVHISTDCVFDGKKGGYTEKDAPNPEDLYGKTKALGEVAYPHCITLRTSIIGHELRSKYGLVEWFLSQSGSLRGFTKAIYSGFPTIELARIISEYVLPNRDLHGIYNVSSEPISKYELLKLIAKRYAKDIRIDPFDDFVLDRSLDSSLFRAKSGYIPPNWADLVEAMHFDQHKRSAKPGVLA